MPMPLWFGKVNKHVFNKRELKQGKRPVLTHVGRVSGREYRTPLEVFPVEGGFLITIMYGPGTDWLRNVLAAGSATVRIEGAEHAVVNPRVIDKTEAGPLLPAGVKPPPAMLNVSQYLRLDLDS